MMNRLCPNFRPENIAAAVSAFRHDGEVPRLIGNPMEGGQCRIYKVGFADGSWSLRIPHVHCDLNGYITAHHEDFLLKSFTDERDIIQEVAKSGFLWAPKLLGSSLTFDNDIGRPFMLLSWIEGSPLQWDETHPPRPVRDIILSQVAQIHMSLIQCTQELSETKPTEFCSRIIDNKICRVRAGALPDLSEEDCEAQKAILSTVLYPELEDAPFAMDHGDLSPLNIIVNSEHKVTGIIDWGFASKVPFQFAACFPRFLRLTRLVLPPTIVLKQDRAAYIASLTNSQVAQRMALIYTSDDVDFRHCFLESIVSKGMHHELAKLHWSLPSRNPKRNYIAT